MQDRRMTDLVHLEFDGLENTGLDMHRSNEDISKLIGVERNTVIRIMNKWTCIRSCLVKFDSTEYLKAVSHSVGADTDALHLDGSDADNLDDNDRQTSWHQQLYLPYRCGSQPRTDCCNVCLNVQSRDVPYSNFWNPAGSGCGRITVDDVHEAALLSYGAVLLMLRNACLYVS